MTLLSYAHLAFMIRNLPKNKAVLEKLWNVGKGLKDSNDVNIYWAAVEELLAEIKGTARVEWLKAKKDSLDLLPLQATEQIAFLEHEKAEIANFPAMQPLHD